MAIKKCKNGHVFVKNSTCPVCPFCSRIQMNKKYADEFSNIGAPAFRALDSIGITQLSQLTNYTEQQLLDLHKFGPKALKLLKIRLQEKGMSFSEK
jgi:hypothetical protein